MSSGLTPERWAMVKGVFAAARKAPPRDRGAIVASLCDGDEELVVQVHALLEHENEMPELETPARLLGLSTTDGERATDGAGAVLPERVGSYSVLRLVGAGRFGAVYEAVQPKTRRVVALKVLKLGRTGARALQRFEFEATALARLSHPGIAQIYEAGVDAGTGEARPFLAMEMVGGLEITAYAKREQLDVRSRAKMVIAVCEAAQHAHERGIVHLDLKPANIVVTPQGKPKIVDFGIAMVTDSTEGGGGSPSERGGTLPYMSPEQLAGRLDEIDLRSDVYALGVLLYELIEGRLPREIAGLSYVEAILRAKAGGGFVFGRGAGADADIGAIVARATAGDRGARYPSALEMAMDLRRFLEDRPVSARRATAWYVARKFVKRRKGASVAMGAGALGLIGAFAWSAWSGREARADAAIARELVTLVLNEEVARIADTQGTQEARRSWLGHVRPKVMALLERHPEDPGIALVAARLLVLESDVEHESARMDRALALRQEAMSLRSGATLRGLSDERALMDRSINLVKVGDIFFDRKMDEKGRRYYEQALRIDEELAAREGASIEALDNLAWSYDRMRRFATTARERRELCAKQLGLAEELVRRDPHRALSWTCMSNARLVVADASEAGPERAENLEKALADARRAMEIDSQSRSVFRAMIVALRRVIESSPTDTPDASMRSLVHELENLAEQLRHSERWDMQLCGLALLARMCVAECAIRWGDREDAADMVHEIEAVLPDYQISLAGRADEMGVMERYKNLAASFGK
ncbi:MAG: serine/threonine protein kinase [Phycisphaerae bacterium]|nr:serine/threonine protein kinase [Phycisphaerae bacterium]